MKIGRYRESSYLELHDEVPNYVQGAKHDAVEAHVVKPCGAVHIKAACACKRSVVGSKGPIPLSEAIISSGKAARKLAIRRELPLH